MLADQASENINPQFCFLKENPQWVTEEVKTGQTRIAEKGEAQPEGKAKGEE
ncbi:MAG: hypothetical protein ACK5ES_04265 [Planctomyces sp.]